MRLETGGAIEMMGSGYWGWSSTRTWTLKFAWLPARMDTGRFIWWKDYYHGVRVITGPGTPVVLHQYMTVEDFTWAALKES